MEDNFNNIPEEYKPISMWGYFGYQLLFSIPCVGIILLLVFSFGGTKNKNLRNFARSYFCFIILISVIIFMVTVVGGISILGSMGY
ncbi:MAG: hypothetical protein E6929_08305 [Clostridium sp.]|nr:hypothetical protein [Clostridium sp.]